MSGQKELHCFVCFASHPLPPRPSRGYRACRVGMSPHHPFLGLSRYPSRAGRRSHKTLFATADPFCDLVMCDADISLLFHFQYSGFTHATPTRCGATDPLEPFLRAFCRIWNRNRGLCPDFVFRKTTDPPSPHEQKVAFYSKADNSPVPFSPSPFSLSCLSVRLR